MSRRLVWLMLFGLCACVGAPRPKEALRRCIWLTRWDWRTRADLEGAIARCADAGFTTVMFQARGNGTVLYRSKLEVWSEQVGFRDPGFDPLAVALDAAHARGVELLAWINVTPGWRGADVPADPRQLWMQRPEWFLSDDKGQRQPQSKSGYLHLNPCLPEVRAYLTSLVREVAENYAVDGIHLDYIRFPSKDPAERGTGYPKDRRTLDLAKREANLDPLKNEVAFERWKTECVTRLVREIRGAVLATPRAPHVSAAVWATPMLARERVNQDWSVWAQHGLVDALFPMNYQADDGVFRAQLDECVRGSHGVPLVVGISPEKHKTPEQTIRQIESARSAGVSGTALFGYQSLFGRPGEPAGRKQLELRQALDTLKEPMER